MTSRFSRDDWESALGRWTDAGLIDDETADSIRAWEVARGKDGARSHGRVADAAAYLGVSIVVAAVLMLGATVIDDSAGFAALGFAVGVVAGGVAWLSSRARAAALSDACAGAAVLLIAVGLGILLDELGEEDDAWIGWLLITLCVAVVGIGLFWSVRSRLAVFAASAALALMPLTLSVGVGALESGIYGGGRSLDGWQPWLTFVLVALVGVLLLYGLGRIRRWLDPAMANWGRLGASLGVAVAVLGLAGASDSLIMDWMALLAGWAITGWALRDARPELLPASALLLIGALAGGLSDVNDGARLGLIVIVLLTAFELTAIGLAGPRLTGRLAGHWLTPAWESALLIAGVTAATILAAESPEWATIGIVWSLVLLIGGVFWEHRIAFVFGIIGVYAAGLTLVLGQFDSSAGAAFGTLAFGVLVVLAGIVWRRRFRVAVPD